MNPQKGFSIAIDGPVASGKGTIARMLAERLNGFDLYTGAMYRCVALYCIENAIDLTAESLVVNALSNIQLDLRDKKIFLNNKDVTERIKESDTASGSSVVGVYLQVRRTLVKRQQEIAQREIENGKVVVAEGRDVGTVVLPNAQIKIFITADPLVRAKRRKEQENLPEELEEVLEEVRKRDYRDTHRDLDPMVSEPEKFGYFIVDTSNQTQEESVATIMEEIKKRGLIK